MVNQFISLNPQVLALLASSDINNIKHLSEVLDEPAVTHRSQANMAQGVKVTNEDVRSNVTMTRNEADIATLGATNLSLNNTGYDEPEKVNVQISGYGNTKNHGDVFESGRNFDDQDDLSQVYDINEHQMPAILQDALNLVC